MDDLLAWFKRHSIHIDADAIAFECGRIKQDGGWGVVAKRDLKEGDIVARIATSAILSSQSSACANILHDEEIGGSIALVIAFMYEKRLEEASPWYEYLSTLPDRVDVPVFWDDDDVAYLQGTDVYDSLLDYKRHLREDYDGIVVPLVHAYPALFPREYFTFDAFSSATSVVASRAFYVNDFHGDALVPLADIFNHSTRKEHVHVESDALVCDVCGSSTGCDHIVETDSDESNHDIDLDDVDVSHSWETASDASSNNEADEQSDDQDEGTLDMTVVRPCRQGDEVFNTYGDHGNASLLLKYGFCELNNPCDVISISAKEVMACVEKSNIMADHVKPDTCYGIHADGSMDKKLFKVLNQLFPSNPPVKKYTSSWMEKQRRWKKRRKEMSEPLSEEAKTVLGRVLDARRSTYRWTTVDACRQVMKTTHSRRKWAAMLVLGELEVIQACLQRLFGVSSPNEQIQT